MSLFGSALDRFGRNSSITQVLKHVALEELKGSARYNDPRKLARYEHQAFSQGGEDGIIREIFRRIGFESRTFIEIGVGDGLENNTALLLLDNWKGLWVEGDPKCCLAIRKHLATKLDTNELHLVQAMITAENASETISKNRSFPRLDFLSIDVDRNTYYIWRALRSLTPRAIAIEYNAMLPSDMKWVAEYDASKSWNGTSYFGASLKALELLGSEFGYNLVGCDLAGVNAFFVRSDLCGDKFCAPFVAENHFEPIRYFLHGRAGHPRTFRD
jgi:hypothetical protein